MYSQCGFIHWLGTITVHPYQGRSHESALQGRGAQVRQRLRLRHLAPGVRPRPRNLPARRNSLCCCRAPSPPARKPPSSIRYPIPHGRKVSILHEEMGCVEVRTMYISSPNPFRGLLLNVTALARCINKTRFPLHRLRSLGSHLVKYLFSESMTASESRNHVVLILMTIADLHLHGEGTEEVWNADSGRNSGLHRRQVRTQSRETVTRLDWKDRSARTSNRHQSRPRSISPGILTTKCASRKINSLSVTFLQNAKKFCRTRLSKFD